MKDEKGFKNEHRIDTLIFLCYILNALRVTCESSLVPLAVRPKIELFQVFPKEPKKMQFIDIYATVIDICPQDYAETNQAFVLIFLLSF